MRGLPHPRRLPPPWRGLRQRLCCSRWSWTAAQPTGFHLEGAHDSVEPRLHGREDALDVVLKVQCPMEGPRVLPAKPRHLRPGVESFVLRVRLDLDDRPLAAVPDGDAILDAPVDSDPNIFRLSGRRPAGIRICQLNIASTSGFLDKAVVWQNKIYQIGLMLYGESFIWQGWVEIEWNLI